MEIKANYNLFYGRPNITDFNQILDKGVEAKH